MAAKIHDWGGVGADGMRQYWFHCPGCGNSHAFTVGGDVTRPRWQWNGSFDKPTFSPSLLCNQHDAGSRCHSFVTDGKIQFLSDCWHSLAGQTVDIPDWDESPVAD